MFSAIFALLGGLRGLFVIGSFATIIGVLGGYVYSYDARGREIATLTLQLSAEKHSNQVLTENINLDKAAQAELNRALIARLGDLDGSCKELTAVKTSKVKGADDAVGSPISDVLEYIRNHTP